MSSIFSHLKTTGHTANFDDFEILSTCSNDCELMIHESLLISKLKPTLNVQGSFITPPARRAWRSYKFASLDFSVFFFFSVSKVGLPLMGVTAVHSCLSHDF